MNNKSVFRYVASGCFGVLALIYLRDLLEYFDFRNALNLIGIVLIAGALFYKRPQFGVAGAVFVFACDMLWFIPVSFDIFDFLCSRLYKDGVYLLIEYFSYFAISGFWMVAFLKNDVAREMGIFAGIVRTILLAFLLVLVGGNLSFISWSIAVFTIVGSIFLGLSMNVEKRGTTVPKMRQKSTSTTVDQVQQLEQLKTLLDKQIITQEEFDTKKKQLLGL